MVTDTDLGHMGDQGCSEVHPTLGADSLRVSPPPHGAVAEDSSDHSLGRTWEGAVGWRGSEGLHRRGKSGWVNLCKPYGEAVTSVYTCV